MAVSKKFQSQPTAIASFDFTDIASGTGVIIYSGFVTNTSAGLDYHLTADETINSTLIESEATAITATVDLDFDLTAFNTPRTLKGTAIVSFGLMGISGDTSSNLVATAYVRKWDGTTETEIASTTTDTKGLGAAETFKSIKTIPITIPKTQFKKGEILRLTIIATNTRTAGGGNPVVAFGHDPTNRDGTRLIPSTDDPDTLTKLVFYAPFDLDV